MLSREVTNAAASTRISVGGDVQTSADRAAAAGGVHFISNPSIIDGF